MAILSEALTTNISLDDIDNLNRELKQRLQSKFLVQPLLTRSLVSFQANKTRPVYRWYKYKEAFSAALVEVLFQKHGVTTGRILDPFAGSGTALFAASALGIASDGIELLPIGQYLRWDHRSGRRQGARPFDKGPILSFEQAISEKINRFQ